MKHLNNALNEWKVKENSKLQFMELALLIVICSLLIFLIYVSKHRNKGIYVEKHSSEFNENEAIELKNVIEKYGSEFNENEAIELKNLIDKYRNMKDDNEWWKPCQECQYFEGYDICTRKENFGAITDISKARCEKHNLFVKK